MKKLSTWDNWKKGEHKQLGQSYDQKLFRDSIDPITLPKTSIILRPYWNYVAKRSGVCWSRQCCNGLKNAAPQFHAMTSTWSSCVELSIQSLYLSLCASQCLVLYGSDSCDAYARSLRPVTTLQLKNGTRLTVHNFFIPLLKTHNPFHCSFLTSLYLFSFILEWR